jgi:hypothetical protein
MTGSGLIVPEATVPLHQRDGDFGVGRVIEGRVVEIDEIHHRAGREPVLEIGQIDEALAADDQPRRGAATAARGIDRLAIAEPQRGGGRVVDGL